VNISGGRRRGVRYQQEQWRYDYYYDVVVVVD